MIIRGAGPCFCAGYDLGAGGTTTWSERSPTSTAGGRATSSTTGSRCGTWRRRSSARSTATAWPAAPSWRRRATSCTSPRTRQIGYPPVRLMSPPDMQWQTWLMGLRHGMEALLTGDSMSGVEAAERGFANRAYPAAELDARRAGDRRAHRQGPARPAGAQQARRPPGDGGDGHPRRHARDAPTSRRSASTSRRRGSTWRRSPPRASPRRSASATASSATTAPTTSRAATSTSSWSANWLHISLYADLEPAGSDRSAPVDELVELGAEVVLERLDHRLDVLLHRARRLVR